MLSCDQKSTSFVLYLFRASLVQRAAVLSINISVEILFMIGSVRRSYLSFCFALTLSYSTVQHSLFARTRLSFKKFRVSINELLNIDSFHDWMGRSSWFNEKHLLFTLTRLSFKNLWVDLTICSSLLILNIEMGPDPTQAYF